ncbi:signal recognition particle, SRP9/SRP14 subunit [Aaosphaeria arxii CBS 175.79]|uniref:Signal recognition particle subunit SRP14 n=1 Tax=Aaosphaeria arxii CBS 175.79 TaxID=1450172 RepID=A0A6A5XFX1_9PLEO|nr:signal recognition particle, SRP9/SRP14 subunit [Aaosphaeria arxii CBS 175.79]KAF2012058.1 signal recognition particle, SRP9/SRP14 subunit [Aaosphaeria arxii CBS 175.79]
MADAHLTNDEFFAQLASLFEHNRKTGHGTVYLTQKRLAYGTDASAEAKAEDPLWDAHPEQPLPILIRASNNKSSKRKGAGRPGSERDNATKTKTSTVVQPDQLEAFYVRYAEACRAGMSGLKKRDRTKKKKDKKKKKGAAGEVKG